MVVAAKCNEEIEMNSEFDTVQAHFFSNADNSDEDSDEDSEEEASNEDTDEDANEDTDEDTDEDTYEDTDKETDEDSVEESDNDCDEDNPDEDDSEGTITRMVNSVKSFWPLGESSVSLLQNNTAMTTVNTGLEVSKAYTGLRLNSTRLEGAQVSNAIKREKLHELSEKKQKNSKKSKKKGESSEKSKVSNPNKKECLSVRPCMCPVPISPKALDLTPIYFSKPFRHHPNLSQNRTRKIRRSLATRIDY